MSIFQGIHSQTNTLSTVPVHPSISNSISTDKSEKLTFSVPDVAKLLDLSQNSVYEAIKTKQIPSISFGRRILIPSGALKKILQE
jgi:excisionase family DNA binding protein